MTQNDPRSSEDVSRTQTDESTGEKVHVSIAPYVGKESFDEGHPEQGHHNHPKRFLCWHLTKKQWIAAVAGCVLLVAGAVLLAVFLAVIPSLFQQNVDKVQLSINYMDIKSLPTDANLNVIDVELSVHVAFNASADARMDDAQAVMYYDNKPFGSIRLPAQSFSKHNKSFDMMIRNSVEITDPAVFRSLSKALVNDSQVSIDTHAVLKAHAMGLSYGGLKLDRQFTLKAFHQFKDPKPQVNSIKLSECTADAYKMLINITLDNESLVGIGGVGALNLSVYYQQDYLGQAISMDASLGIPRGAASMVIELTIIKTTKMTTAMLSMVGGLLGGKAQFYVTGNHPYATKAVLLNDAFAALNISMLYTDGLSKVTISPTCNLLSILTGGR